MLCFEFIHIWLIAIFINGARVLKLFFRDVDDIVSRFRKTSTHSLLQYLLLFNHVDPVVVVLAPYPLRVVSDIRVVMTAFSSSVVDAHTMQVVWHAL